jgi:hypothetical protein
MDDLLEDQDLAGYNRQYLVSYRQPDYRASIAQGCSDVAHGLHVWLTIASMIE